MDMRTDTVAKHALESDADWSILERLRRGDGRAMGEFIARNEPWVRSMAFAVLGRADMVDDASQRVWLAVWRRAGTLAETGNWRNWMYQITRNAAIDMLRHEKRRRGLWESVKAIARTSTSAASAADERLLMAEEHRAALRALQGLPQSYRVPFALRHLEGWNYVKIAEVMDLSVDAVETRMVRARQMLRKRLEKELDK